jgi:hypothetical protein
MRILLALAAAAVTLTAAADHAQAQAPKRNRDLVVQVKPRSYLDAGTNVQPGAYQNYSLGFTPARGYDSAVPTGSPEQRLLPGRYGVNWQ